VLIIGIGAGLWALLRRRKKRAVDEASPTQAVN